MQNLIIKVCINIYIYIYIYIYIKEFFLIGYIKEYIDIVFQF